MDVQKQSSFSRTIINDAKMGAYYTDLSHCSDLSELFSFPEETCVLEPSIGDGSAVIAITDREHNSNVKIFGVELNDETVNQLRKNPMIDCVLKADFTNGVRISNNKFTFCFANPPYIKDYVDSEGKPVRLERIFLEKVGFYLAKGAILVWVIPHSVYVEENYFRYFNSRYETLHTFKFRADEFAKYKQVCVIARKRKVDKMFQKDVLTDMRNSVSLENLEEVPYDFSSYEKIVVPGSKEKDITLFAEKEFDLEAANAVLNDNPKVVLDSIDECISTKKYFTSKIGNPPIPLKNDSMYLLVTSGAGQGLTGSVENQDLHLQRGVAKLIEEGEVIEPSNPDGMTTAKVTTRTAIKITVVQNDGTISVLE